MATIHRLSVYRTRRILEKFATLSDKINEQSMTYSYLLDECKSIANEAVSDHGVIIDKSEMFKEKLKQSRELCTKCEEVWQKNNISETVNHGNHLFKRNKKL